MKGVYSVTTLRYTVNIQTTEAGLIRLRLSLNLKIMSEQIVVAVIGAIGGVVAASIPQVFAW
ncbi:MAG TPA: hypothetical protein DEV81_06290 [Cyanobacteria bacterium UBA11049]|nr:hypothetical protein [Cyanobacteria bacterium UBA11049]